MFIKSFPDEVDLLGFFESLPMATSEVADLHFAYQTHDGNGLEIIFHSVLRLAGHKQSSRLMGKKCLGIFPKMLAR